MKKRLFSLLLCLAMLLPSFTLVGCPGGPSYDKTNQLLKVMEGTFRSAYFEIPAIGNNGGNGGGNGGQNGGGQNGDQNGDQNDGAGLSDKNPMFPGDGGQNAGDQNGGQNGDKKPNLSDKEEHVRPDKQKTYNAARADLSSSAYLAELSAVVDSFLGVNGGVPLTANNKKALAGEALSEGSPFAGTLRALLAVYGDDVFANNYTTSGMTFAVSGEGNTYTVKGVLQDKDGFRSAIIMTFTEESKDIYSYVFAKYSINDDPSFSHSTLNISAYASETGVLRAELQAKSADIFTSYDRAYSAFEVTEFTGASFAMDNYTSLTLSDASDGQVKTVMDFARDVLGFNNATFSDLRAVRSGKTITGSEASKLASIIASCIYVSPYYYQTNETYVRDSYTVPADVKVVKTASIPAARKIYIHGNVEKIESKPFQAPQYVEDIVFIDPTGGKLTEIGSFDANLGHPSFLLSLTKVKNFTLPASVKKLELGEYILNTEVNLIDLSAYEPAWLDDPSLMTCTYNEFSKDNRSRAEFKESAYANLTLCGTESFFFQEVRYIHELRMPQFNMGIRYKDTTHLNIFSDAYGEYYAEAYEDIYKAFYAFTGDEGSFARFDEFVAMKGYTRTFSSIGTLVVHDNTRIATDEMLFGEFGVGTEKEEGKGEDKENKQEEEKKKEEAEKQGIDATHDLVEMTLYRDTMDKGHSPDEPPFTTYATIAKIIAPATFYDALVAEEESRYNSIHYYDGMDVVVRVVIEAK